MPSQSSPVPGLARAGLVALALVVACLTTGAVVPPAAESPPLLENGLARTPPMGWNSWNHFGCDVSDSLMRQTADAMAASGMRDAGYRYLVIDDCWQVARAKDGTIVADSVRFPHGIKALADYVHSKGLKFGIYTDAGRLTCQKRPGTYGHEVQDARTYAAWGVDYVKEDWCHAEGLDAPRQYAKFRDALRATRRPIVFSICEWGLNQPWDWAPRTGNLWRTTDDIEDRWGSMLSNLDVSAQHASAQRPGAWNDPDMLEIGNGGMTDAEYRAHFSLWAMLGAPLIAGNDVRTMSAATREILLNREVIAIDQDALGRQGMLTEEQEPGHQVWVKPLAGGATAVVLLNRGDTAATIGHSFRRGGIGADSVDVRDLWAHADRGRFHGSYRATVPPHAAVMLRATPVGGGRALRRPSSGSATP